MAGPVKGAGRITRLALLTAIALTIFMAEAQLPVLPIPGVKLGLANIVTVYAMFALGPRDALLVLSSRVFLGAVFSGQMMTLFYSGAGGLLSWSMLALLRRPLGRERIWLASPVSALFHNLGQLLAAAGIARSWAVLAYLPYLVLAGCAAGLFTGVAAQALAGRLGRMR
ncbi:Gx transporter family protein [Oscillospiraceae bacterium 50-16]